MTKLAVSDSPLSRKLLRGSLDAVYLETSAHLSDSVVSEHPDVPLLLHNSLWDWSLAHPDALNHKDALAVTKQRLAATGAPFLSIHLGFSAAEIVFNNGMQTLSPTLERDALLTTTIQNVSALKAAIDVPLLLENLDYVPGAAYEHICDPDFIAEVLNAADVYFLLDLAHAQVSSASMDIALDDYLARLPLNRVRQLHVSSPREKDGQLYDAHEPLQAYDYALLKTLLTKTEVWAVTLEYTRSEADLLNQIIKLQNLLG